jgi:hypothetical protein
MRRICINPMVVGLAVVGTAGAYTAAMLPEIKRYLKIRSM